MYRLLFNLNTEENMAFHCTLSLRAGNLDNNNIWSPNQMLRSLGKEIWILALKAWIVFTSVIFFLDRRLTWTFPAIMLQLLSREKKGYCFINAIAISGAERRQLGKLMIIYKGTLAAILIVEQLLLLIHQQMWQFYQLPSLKN